MIWGFEIGRLDWRLKIEDSIVDWVINHQSVNQSSIPQSPIQSPNLKSQIINCLFHRHRGAVGERFDIGRGDAFAFLDAADDLDAVAEAFTDLQLAHRELAPSTTKTRLTP